MEIRWRSAGPAPDQKNADVYVQQIGTGAPFRLTTDPADDYSPIWSPDGRSIAFLRRLAGPQRHELRLISPLGGSERKVTEIQSGRRVPPPDHPGVVPRLQLRRGHRFARKVQTGCAVCCVGRIRREKTVDGSAGRARRHRPRSVSRWQVARVSAGRRTIQRRIVSRCAGQQSDADGRTHTPDADRALFVQPKVDARQLRDRVLCERRALEARDRRRAPG